MPHDSSPQGNGLTPFCPRAISGALGGALLGAAANRQVCPTISEMTFGNQSSFSSQPARARLPLPGGRSPLLGRAIFSGEILAPSEVFTGCGGNRRWKHGS